MLRYGVLTASLISIHALLAESDDTSKVTIKTVVNFYPRSPCGERRYLINTYHRIFGISIHALLAESDSALGGTTMPEVYFYPRSPCGERHLRVVDGSKSSIISIHALLAESDYDGLIASANFCRFLSTLSLRRATVGTNNHVRVSQNFYPRSPCGERLTSVVNSTGTMDFYPRSPCGERLYRVQETLAPNLFLSTLSLRRATQLPTPEPPRVFRFLSTLSLRRATRGGVSCYLDNIISIHALLAESDNSAYGALDGASISIHALLAESDRAPQPPQGKSSIFLSTLSLRRATLAGPSGPAFLYNFYPRSPCGERHGVIATKDYSPCISIHALLAESDPRGCILLP